MPERGLSEERPLSTLLLSELLERRHFSVSAPYRVGLYDLVHGRRNCELTLQVHQTLLREILAEPEQNDVLQVCWAFLEGLDTARTTPTVESVPVL